MKTRWKGRKLTGSMQPSLRESRLNREFVPVLQEYEGDYARKNVIFAGNRVK